MVITLEDAGFRTPWICTQVYNFDDYDLHNYLPQGIPTAPWAEKGVVLPNPALHRGLDDASFPSPDGKSYLYWKEGWKGPDNSFYAQERFDPPPRAGVFVNILSSNTQANGFQKTRLTEEEEPMYKKVTLSGDTGWSELYYNDRVERKISYQGSKEYVQATEGEFKGSFVAGEDTRQFQETYRWKPGYDPGPNESLPEVEDWASTNLGDDGEVVFRDDYDNEHTITEFSEEYTQSEVDGARLDSIQHQWTEETEGGYLATQIRPYGRFHNFGALVKAVKQPSNYAGWKGSHASEVKVYTRAFVWGAPPGNYKVEMLYWKATLNADRDLGPWEDPGIIEYTVSVPSLSTAGFSSQKILKPTSGYIVSYGKPPEYRGYRGWLLLGPGSDYRNNGRCAGMRLTKV